MLTVHADFLARRQEIDLYFLFLREFDENRITFVEQPPNPPSFSTSDQTELFKTLKANGFLLLYNLVESTSKNAIEAIFDECRGKNVSFDDCRSEVRHIVLQNLRGHDIGKVLEKVTTLAIDIVAETFRKERLFSGNVDARKIKEMAKAYGFLSPKRKSDGLLTVKARRNDLAHGDKSFAEVGRNFPVQELETIKDEVVAFLEELLTNIEAYILAREYLAVP